MNNYFYLDCEFNGFGGELLSIALVSKDLNHEFYEVIEYPENELKYDSWVLKHVVPILNRKPKSKQKIQNKLSQFLLDNANELGYVTVIADWPDDIRYFCELLITGPGMSVSTPNITFVLDRKNLPDTSRYSKIPHNALEDARALARGFD